MGIQFGAIGNWWIRAGFQWLEHECLDLSHSAHLIYFDEPDKFYDIQFQVNFIMTISFHSKFCLKAMYADGEERGQVIRIGESKYIRALWNRSISCSGLQTCNSTSLFTCLKWTLIVWSPKLRDLKYQSSNADFKHFTPLAFKMTSEGLSRSLNCTSNYLFYMRFLYSGKNNILKDSKGSWLQLPLKIVAIRQNDFLTV